MFRRNIIRHVSARGKRIADMTPGRQADDRIFPWGQ
jgi:hypothetical protein